MLQFSSMQDAIVIVNTLRDLFWGARITDNYSGKVLYSTIPSSLESDELFGGDIESSLAQKKKHLPYRVLIITQHFGAYERILTDALIGGSFCLLELLQPISERILTKANTAPTGWTESIISIPTYAWLLTDKLTGLYNSRYLNEYLPAAINTAKERKIPLSVILCEIDQLSDINDRYGLFTGDLLLQFAATHIQQKTRNTESWVVRSDDNEFAVCLLGIDHPTALRVAERVRAFLQEEFFDTGYSRISITCSFGVATCLPDSGSCDANELVRKAREEMVLARNSGGDAVM